jgi:hypothetical protein
MNRTHRSTKLLFPELVPAGVFQLKHQKDDYATSIPSYRLGWSKMDEVLKERHDKWKKKIWTVERIQNTQDFPNSPLRFLPGLQDKQEKLVQNQIFAISHDYLHEIRRCIELVLVEDRHSYPFDTIVRDACMGARDAYIKVAFYLLADCSVDEETSWWSRDPILPHAMLYRLWYNQTGFGNLEEKADFVKLERKMEFPDVNKVTILEFLKATPAIHKREVERYHEYIKAVRHPEMQPDTLNKLLDELTKDPKYKTLFDEARAEQEKANQATREYMDALIAHLTAEQRKQVRSWSNEDEWFDHVYVASVAALNQATNNPGKRVYLSRLKPIRPSGGTTVEEIDTRDLEKTYFKSLVDAFCKDVPTTRFSYDVDNAMIIYHGDYANDTSPRPR